MGQRLIPAECLPKHQHDIRVQREGDEIVMRCSHCQCAVRMPLAEAGHGEGGEQAGDLDVEAPDHGEDDGEHEHDDGDDRA
jgi:hypothetical protein